MFSKRIEEIQNNKNEEFEKFKPERIESLKFLDVKKRAFDFKKKTFKRKLK